MRSLLSQIDIKEIFMGKSLIYYALSKNKGESREAVDKFLAERGQNLQSFLKDSMTKISADTQNYNSFLADSSLLVPDDQISVARSLRQKGSVAAFNKLNLVNDDSIAMLFDCKKNDDMNPWQVLHMASFNAPNNIMIMEHSPIILPTRVWLSSIQETNMNSLLDDASFAREKCALSDAFFNTLFEGADETTPFSNDVNPAYTNRHPEFDVTDTSEKVLIPVPQEYLNPQNREAAEIRSIIDKSARNYITKNSRPFYTLYSMRPICSKIVETPVCGKTDFYVFAVEYNSFDKNGEYIGGNLYLCGSCKNIAPITQGDRTVYSFDDKNRYVSLCADKNAYDSLRNKTPRPVAMPLTGKHIDEWLSNYIIPEFSTYMGTSDMGANVITSEDMPEIRANIDKLLSPNRHQNIAYPYIKNRPEYAQSQEKTDEQ